MTRGEDKIPLTFVVGLVPLCVLISAIACCGWEPVAEFVTIKEQLTIIGGMTIAAIIDFFRGVR